MKDFLHVKAQDLKVAAYHEAGHALFFHLNKIHWSLEIFPNRNGGYFEKFYTGRVTGFANLPPRKHQIMGLAGPMAEVMFAGPDIDLNEYDAIDVFDLIDLEEVSATDKAAIGSPEDDVIIETYEILLKHHQWCREVAEELMYVAKREEARRLSAKY